MADEKQKQAPAYTTGAYIIDKALVNFSVGLAVGLSILISVFFVILRLNHLSFCPVIMFFIIAGGFVYAFGFMGAFVASCKEKSFKITRLRAVLASIISSFSFMFPIYFVVSILYFLMFFVPNYQHTIVNYVPKVTNIQFYLQLKYCNYGEFCLWTSAFGKLIGNLIEALLLGVGLAIVFSIINSITAFLKVAADTKPEPPPQKS
jgi:hypothetical protein